MSSAGLNSQKDIDKGIMIHFINVLPIVNSLAKEEKPGDATKAIESAKERSFEKGEPNIDATASANQLTIDDDKKEAFRIIVVDGKQVKIKLKNYKEIKMKHAEWKKREGIEDRNKDQDAR